MQACVNDDESFPPFLARRPTRRRFALSPALTQPRNESGEFEGGDRFGTRFTTRASRRPRLPSDPRQKQSARRHYRQSQAARERPGPGL